MFSSKFLFTMLMMSRDFRFAFSFALLQSVVTPATAKRQTAILSKPLSVLDVIGIPTLSKISSALLIIF